VVEWGGDGLESECGLEFGIVIVTPSNPLQQRGLGGLLYSLFGSPRSFQAQDFVQVDWVIGFCTINNRDVHKKR
jgi:hypothetical protein